MILIKNGRVVDAKSNTDEVLDVVIDGGNVNFMVFSSQIILVSHYGIVDKRIPV